MKYAFMSFSCPDLSLTEMLSLARRLGYDGIEPRIGSGHGHGVEMDTDADRRREIRKQAEDSGIALCCISTSCKYADPRTAPQQTQDTLRCIDLAGDAGAPRLRVFGGGIPPGISREEAIVSLAQSLRSVADHAEQRGVTVCVETHDDWCDPRHVAEVMRRVDHPAIAVNWDLMHPVRRGNATMEEAFRTLAPWIRHVHFHDGDTLGLKPIGEGDIDHRQALDLLRAAAYDGFLSGEWISWEPYAIHLPRELATMRRYEEEAAR
jgi:sugar phosphate isomerase/epimerase